MSAHPFADNIKTLEAGGQTHKYFSLPSLNDPRLDSLPYSIRVLLESAVRNCDNFAIFSKDVETILDWEKTSSQSAEIPFKPARVLLQDFTGVPAVVDLAAMREAMKALGGDPEKINPLVPVDAVIDHSVQVDAAGTPDAAEKNAALEFQRNHERFKFLKWGQSAFKNMVVIPPGTNIVHQCNLEYLARVVMRDDDTGMLACSSLVGTDSHSTMIAGLGVLGWGVGGLEAEAVMLGQAISLVLPEVIGYKLTGELPLGATATDLVLTVVEHLRQVKVVGKFVEFFGPGIQSLSLADRATLSNMSPETGATTLFFPPDEVAIDYLRQTGRPEAKIATVEAYLKAQGMFRDYSGPDPKFTKVLELDLATIVPSLSGPKRPHDRVPLSAMKTDFAACLANPVGFKGFAIPEDRRAAGTTITVKGKECAISHGSVVIAAITSCTNTSNPDVMLAAGLLAKRAVEAGIADAVSPICKTSLAPGSAVVTRYLQESGLLPYLEKLGFYVVGFGCAVCIGNSGPLADPAVEAAIEDNDLVVAGVLSGNRNFEGRVSPHTRANYLASPPLVVAYALAGRVDIDFETEPVARSADGKDVFLKDLWPSRDEITKLTNEVVKPKLFEEVYNNILSGNERWNALEVAEGSLYQWDPESTYIHLPPYFEGMGAKPTPASNGSRAIKGARALLNVGDSVTTDHISPAGAIARSSPAARYLIGRGVEPKDFNSYGSRRGNDEVMVRGTFANIRLVNKLVDSKPGPRTKHVVSGEVGDVYDIAMKYKEEGIPAIILAGREYGSGSSRDWAGKGPMLQGVKAVIAVSYERIHRSNLIGMGVVPLQFKDGQDADSLGLTGHETFEVHIPDDVNFAQDIKVTTDTGVEFSTLLRIDTAVELQYYFHGGILQYVLRKLLGTA